MNQKKVPVSNSVNGVSVLPGFMRWDFSWQRFLACFMGKEQTKIGVKKRQWWLDSERERNQPRNIQESGRWEKGAPGIQILEEEQSKSKSFQNKMNSQSQIYFPPTNREKEFRDVLYCATSGLKYKLFLIYAHILIL